MRSEIDSVGLRLALVANGSSAPEAIMKLKIFHSPELLSVFNFLNRLLILVPFSMKLLSRVRNSPINPVSRSEPLELRNWLVFNRSMLTSSGVANW